MGIADDPKDAEAFCEHYNARCIKFNDILITGVELEAKKYYNSIDGYKKVLCKGITKAKDVAPDGVIDHILRTMQQVVYNNRVLIIFELSTDKPIFFKNKLFVRHDSHNTEVVLGSPEYEEITAAFHKAQGQTTEPDSGTKTSIFT